ncbi:MAG: hypothetical protein NVS3B8_13720 [Chitinophagaceae bacterium]
MNKICISIILLFLILPGLTAQQAPAASKWIFHSVIQVGLLQGENKAAFNLQSVNGFQYNNFFTGLGTGLDYYRYKSIPLFADFRIYVGKTNNQFFIYADAGVHFIWEKKDNSSFYPETYYPGFYGSAGVGYKAGFKNGMGLILSTGYSYKRVNDRRQQHICGIIGPCYIQSDAYTYNLNRLMIQIGWMF